MKMSAESKRYYSMIGLGFLNVLFACWMFSFDRWYYDAIGIFNASAALFAWVIATKIALSRN